MRANRAAFEQADGALDPLIGARFEQVYAGRPDIADDLERDRPRAPHLPA